MKGKLDSVSRRGSGYKLKHMKFLLNTRIYFLTVEVVKLWNRLPKKLWSYHSWRC